MSVVAGHSRGFRTLYAEDRKEPGWNAMHGGQSAQEGAPPEDDDPVEAAAREAFVQGFQEGGRIAREATEADDMARLALAEALSDMASTGEGTLATLLSHAVIRLVGQIVGEVPIDETLLQERCAAVAGCIDGDTAKAMLEVNPEDIALIDASLIGMALTPNAELARGSVRLATSEGWVEDGPDVRLSRLKALMDDMEGRA